MLRRISWFVMLALLVALPAIGCKNTRPTPAGHSPAGFTPTPPSGVDPAVSRTPEVAEEWVCPMHPQVRMSQPGRCSICGMDLVRSSESSGASSGSGHSDSSGSGHSHSSGSGCGHCG